MTHWRPLTRPDVPAWAALTNHLATVDGTEEFYAEEDLAEELTEHGFCAATDSWTAWDGDIMIGYGQLRVRGDHDGRSLAHLGGGIHPDYRRRGLGSELMGIMEARAVHLADERYPGAPQFWRAPGHLEGATVRMMLEQRGYQVIRYWNEMRQPLPAAVAVPDVEATLVSPTDQYQEATRVAHNEAFRDHWGAGPRSVQGWADMWTARANRMPISTLALDADGTVLAYVLVGQWVPQELYINLVGTVPGARGKGLAHAALVRSISLAAGAEGVDYIGLDVDSESSTGATRLYDKVGFVLNKTTASHQRPALRRAP